MRVDMHPGWEAQLTPHVDRFLATRLGPDILADARRLCPVETGYLRDHLDFEVSGGVLRVGSNVDYADDVELGTSDTPAQPHLRPALYRRRTP